MLTAFNTCNGKTMLERNSKDQRGKTEKYPKKLPQTSNCL